MVRGRCARRGAICAALLLVPSALVCAPAPPPRFDRVVLVSIDTLRADHLGFYGYPRETSPFLDGLARDGVVFERAYAPQPTTAPSHATIFTSLYPLQHGLRTNGLRLADDVTTLAEVLRDAGFTTAGFTSTFAQWKPTGLDRGFTVFRTRPRESGEVYRRADATIDAVLAFLAECGDCGRLFLFVHLFDPHAPLRPPTRHVEVFQRQTPAARERHVEFLTGRQGIPLGFYHDDPGRLLFIVDRYDAEIRFADEQLRRLHEALAARGGLERTLWVLTADHGEGLGSHQFMGHGKAYEEGLHVPLLFHAPGVLAARRVPGIVEHVDLAPTLLELVGLADRAAALDGEGRSLVPQLLGADGPPDRAALGQRGSIAMGPNARRLPQEDPGDLSGELYAWIEERFKYLHHTRGDDELYDLAADPTESRNLLAEGDSARAERMLGRLRQRLRALERHTSRPAVPELDAEAREELRALGYAP